MLDRESRIVGVSRDRAESVTTYDVSRRSGWRLYRKTVKLQRFQSSAVSCGSGAMVLRGPSSEVMRREQKVSKVELLYSAILNIELHHGYEGKGDELLKVWTMR